MSESKTKDSLPKDLYLKTGAPGIYIRPADINGDVWVLSEHPLTFQLQEYWASTGDYDAFNLPQINLEGLHRQAVSLPGLLIVPGDMISSRTKNLRVFWKRDDGLPGTTFNFGPHTDEEVDMFEKRIRAVTKGATSKASRSSDEGTSAPGPRKQMDLSGVRLAEMVAQYEENERTETKERSPGDQDEAERKISRKSS